MRAVTLPLQTACLLEEPCYCHAEQDFASSIGMKQNCRRINLSRLASWQAGKEGRSVGPGLGWIPFHCRSIRSCLCILQALAKGNSVYFLLASFDCIYSMCPFFPPFLPPHSTSRLYIPFFCQTPFFRQLTQLLGTVVVRRRKVCKLK